MTWFESAGVQRPRPQGTDMHDQQGSAELNPFPVNRRWPGWILAAIGLALILGGALPASAI